MATTDPTKQTFLSSVLTRVKSFFAKVKPIAEKIGEETVKITEAVVKEEPVIDEAFDLFGLQPVGLLFNAIAGDALSIENAAQAAGSGTGSGSIKLQAVLQSTTVQQAFAQFEADAGVSQHSTGQQLDIINKVVAFLNALNATTATTASA